MVRIAIRTAEKQPALSFQPWRGAALSMVLKVLCGLDVTTLTHNATYLWVPIWPNPWKISSNEKRRADD